MDAFCATYLNNVPFIAKTFLVVALVTAILTAMVGVLQALRAQPTVLESTDRAGATAIAPIIEALKGLVDALAKAPAWFAMFLAGALLFWMAGKAYVDICRPPQPNPPAVNRQAPANPQASQPTQRQAPVENKSG